MSTKTKLILLIAAALFLASCGREETTRETAERLSREFIAELRAENYARAWEQGTIGFRADISIRQLENMWIEILMEAGSFEAVRGVEAGLYGSGYITLVRTEHRNRLVVWELIYETGQDGGLSLSAAEALVLYRPARFGPLPAGVIEESVVIGEKSEFPLNGRLTLPAHIEGPLPAVVLVHDQGAWDMDASVFDNKPFRDIAHYLARRGIAVLRYDSVLYAHPQELERLYGNRLTANRTTVYAAAAARALLYGDERIDQSRVYVLGHGFGGTMAALICARYGYSGWISLAGTPRSPLERAIDARLFAADREGRGPGYQEALRITIEAAAVLYRELGNNYRAAELTLLDIPGYFLQNLINNPPSHYMSYDFPVLVLQGKNNFEVFFDRDFELFKLFLLENENATFRIYENLNHLFMQSTMEFPNLRDYRPYASVDSAVLTDIAEWINSR